MLKMSIVVILAVVTVYLLWSYYNPPVRVRPDLSAELEKITDRQNLGKTLVIYYSLGGNTYDVAKRIQKMTDADLREIRTSENYPSGPVLYLIAGKQLRNNELPKLGNTVADISKYDIIFFGSPVWWYTVPPPVLSFLSQCDFGGKRVVPFITYGGNSGKFFADFKNQIKNAEVTDGIDFRNSENENSGKLNEKILNWLRN